MLVKIEAYNDGKFWCARGIGEAIFTQGKTADEPYKNIREAVELHFDARVPASNIEILVSSELKPVHAPCQSHS